MRAVVRGVSLMLIMLVAACASEIRPPVVRHSGFSIPFPDPDFRAEPEEISQAAAPDYATELKHAARKDKQALERLFAISAAGDWDAAGAEFHSSHMRQLLVVWGVAECSNGLSRQPRSVRRAIGDTLSWPEESEFRSEFPRTYSVATKT
jgi:hypothetical protein